jgi:peptidylprolyl isomerase
MNTVISRARLLAGAVAIAAAALFGGPALAQDNPAPAPTGTPHLMLTLKDGVVDIELRPDLAPNHVARVIELAGQHFYDGTPFHRVIDGFMAQGGDPTGTGMGGSQLPDLKAEFTDKEHFVRGTVGAARSADPDSANSQFFIMFDAAPSLDGQYTIWGQVVSGMDVVDKIKRGSGPDGMVTDPDKIISATIEYR